MWGMLTDRPCHEKHDFRAFQNELVSYVDDKNRCDAYKPVAKHHDFAKCAKSKRKSGNPAPDASFSSRDLEYTKNPKILDIELRKLKMSQRRKLIM